MSYYFITRRGFLSWLISIFILIIDGIFSDSRTFGFLRRRKNKETTMNLPAPKTDGIISVEKAIKLRRTVRSFKRSALTLDELSQLLYSAQGITEDGGYKRSAPSGGALYPLDVYAVVGEKAVVGLDPGVYHYVPSGHRMELKTEGDKRRELARASLHQMWMASAPVNLVITAEYARITSKYGERGVRYALIEVGHAGQNIFLQAEALGLKAGIVGAFHDSEVQNVMGIPRRHEPLLIMPVGYGS